MSGTNIFVLRTLGLRQGGGFPPIVAFGRLLYCELTEFVFMAILMIDLQDQHISGISYKILPEMHFNGSGGSQYM